MKLQKYLLASLGIIFIVFFVCGTACSKSEDNSKPPNIFVDVGACPFECCTYRQWTVARSTILFDKPTGKQKIVTLSVGDVVTGLTGEVRSSPAPVKAAQDIQDTPIKAGDHFYLLHYEGEGYWKIWFRGKLMDIELDDQNMSQPKTEWWVKVKDAQGNMGWALSDQNFDHQDSCE